MHGSLVFATLEKISRKVEYSHKIDSLLFEWPLRSHSFLFFSFSLFYSLSFFLAQSKLISFTINGCHSVFSMKLVLVLIVAVVVVVFFFYFHVFILTNSQHLSDAKTYINIYIILFTISFCFSVTFWPFFSSQNHSSLSHYYYDYYYYPDGVNTKKRKERERERRNEIGLFCSL